MKPTTPTKESLTSQLQTAQTALNAKIAKPVAPAPVAPATPAPTPTASTISATSLAPATPMTLATPAPATQAPGMMAEFQDATDTFTQNLQDQAKLAEAPKTNALNDYIAQLTQAQGVSGLTNDAYAVKGGVNDITPELNDINDKMRRESLSLRRQSEAIANSGGQSKAQAQAQINNIERESFAKQADLAVIQQAVQGRYDSAKEIADRAVTAKLEKQTNDLAILKFNYEENKDAFTLKEQRAFESMVADRTNKLEEERATKTQINDFALAALQAGAPTSVAQQIMSGAKTLDEAIALGGNYLRPKPVVKTVEAPDLQNFGTSDKPIWKQFDPTTGGYIDVKGIGTDPQSNALGNALASNDIDNLNNILTSGALGKAVGPNSLARTSPGLWSATKRFVSGFLSGGATAGVIASPTVVGTLPAAIVGGLATGVVNATRGSMSELTGERQNFIGTVEQMREGLTLDKLAQAKGQGVTFGSLTEGERQSVARSASKIGTWAIKDSNDTVTGYNIDETSFKKEIDTINYFKKLDAILQGADPASVGVQQYPDGTLWVANSDGTFSELKR
jgi:hypothetical protein